MTPEDVRHVAFRKAPFGRRGYQEKAVDDLLDDIASALAGGPPLTSERLRDLPPPRELFARGYHPDEVDAFLARVRPELGL